jgi:large subunit ribosomal protein L23|uniref:50S ribosomal protein L23 n=1 Tax=Ochromonas sp. CCMP1393 TaxID=420556 RepID=A0A0D3MK87_9STRA|nr:50S ribosomal protein L23 [Ochromonas sp. CCMP1393]
MENPTRNLGNLLSLIKYPSLTEKAINLYGDRQYTFIVDRSLRKTEIKYVIEKIFNVTILEVNTCILPTKTKRVGRFSGKKPRYKKTYVKLKEGDSITDLFN